MPPVSAAGIRHVVDQHRPGDTVTLTVSNTGPAVPGYEIPKLFEPFRRLHDRVSSARGTGLGLSIVRSVAQAHGGTATAWPRDGGGLVVTVTLPVAGFPDPAGTTRS
jgi:signal transduction histidine kinase